MAYGCVVSISPDRNSIYFYGAGGVQNQNWDIGYLGNLNNGHAQPYDIGQSYCSALNWSPDSRHFILNGNMRIMVSIDGPPVQIDEIFFAMDRCDTLLLQG